MLQRPGDEMGFTAPGRGRTGLVSSPLEKHHVKTPMGIKGTNGYKSALKCSETVLVQGEQEGEFLSDLGLETSCVTH